jgi:hypothetical protein
MNHRVLTFFKKKSIHTIETSKPPMTQCGGLKASRYRVCRAGRARHVVSTPSPRPPAQARKRIGKTSYYHLCRCHLACSLAVPLPPFGALRRSPCPCPNPPLRVRLLPSRRVCARLLVRAWYLCSRLSLFLLSVSSPLPRPPFFCPNETRIGPSRSSRTPSWCEKTP